ncbi:MAG: TonB-dependent receptor [Pseudomonadales bacterium]
MKNRGRSVVVAASILALGASSTVLAAAGVIEEIVVTAQKRESSLQDTAVAVSAFDQAALDRENIDDALDIQMSVPNLNFTKTNFAGSNLSIRGIGINAVGTSADTGVGIHFNGSYLQQTSIFESEFFDVERVEVLRGPQGTLYGRNTTGGVMNIIPAKAGDEFEASIDGQYGNYQTQKLNGMINVPVNDLFQLRLSGMMLKRDGYTDNQFNGDEIDDRDLWSTRVGLRFVPSDNTELNVFWQHFEEDDSRMRTSNQTCVKDTRTWPFSLGCLPGQDIESYEVLNGNGQLGGILTFLNGIYPLGTDGFANSPKPTDLRKVYSDFSPTYKMEEDIYNAEFTWDISDEYTLTLVGSYQEVEYFTQTDYDWSVPSETFVPNVPGLTDANGTLVTPSDPTVSGYNYQYVYDTSAYKGDTYTLEARLQSDWVDSPWDFLAGAFYMNHTTDDAIYDVHFNTAAILIPVEGVVVDGEFAPLSYYRNDTKDYELETWALFGELYYDLTDRARVTAGVRYSDESKDLRDRQSLLNNPTLPFNPGISGRAFLNDSLTPFIAGITGDRTFYGYSSSGNDPVPPYRSFGDTWTETTGKLGIEYDADLSFTDEALLFATLARSYKSGGINPPSFTGAFRETFDPEYINSLELGAKTKLFDGRMQANTTLFYYDYEGLQTTKIIDRTSVNENIDAKVMGLEAELIWVPTENLRFDAFFSWLDTEIDGSESVDPANPTNGDPNWITAKNVGADVFLVPVSGTWDPSQCGVSIDCANIFESNPVDGAGNPLPVQPNLVQVPIGIPVDLDGNQLPNAPEFSIKLGVEYSFRLRDGMELVPRFDYYWQDKFYYRIYNSKQDQIDSWDIMNASVTLYSGDDTWYVEGFVKNLKDDDYITGGYFTDASSANFSNVFILEPRTFGLTAGYHF